MNHPYRFHLKAAGKALLFFSLPAFLLILILLFSSCRIEKAVSDQADTTVRLGVMYSADIVPPAIILENGLDQKYGFTLDMEVFSSARERDAALQAGELDGVFTDIIGMCMYKNAGIELFITGMTDGDYKLLASPSSGIHSLKEAKGKSAAISENTLIEYTLDYILHNHGFEYSWVKKEVIPRIPERLELFRNGKADLVLLPEPFSTLAEQDGGIVLGSANTLGLYPAVSAFTAGALEAKEAVIQAFYKAYNEAAGFINRTPSGELEEVVIKSAGYPAELSGHILLPHYRENALPDAEVLKEAIAWAAERKLCDSSLKPEELVWKPE